MNPKYPIYIISKGRWDLPKGTHAHLTRMNVEFFIVVEEQEYEQYAKHIDKEKLLILPKKYLEDYDTFWEKDINQSTGPGAARNFCWDHAISLNASRHWVMDDNIYGFFRFNRNSIYLVETGAMFRAMEDFVDRYENVAIAGPNYQKFIVTNEKYLPFRKNIRIYSCLLIKNDLPFRWRGRYNEDTDLCLNALKLNYCTIQFNAFLQEKITTQRISGGNTAEFYAQEGTYNKSKMLVDMHPDVTSLVWRFDRWHHEVYYEVFKKISLIRKKDIEVLDRINNYGMTLVDSETNEVIGPSLEKSPHKQNIIEFKESFQKSLF